jgi:hypothetical protein
MGCCCYPEPNPDGSRNCGGASGSEACGVGGTFSDGDCGDCFLLTALGTFVSSKGGSQDNLVLEILARPSFMVMFDFRDVILRKSPLGREVLDLYQAHQTRAGSILSKHPVLLLRSLKVLARGIVLAQDILRAYSLGSHGVATGALQLDHDSFSDLLPIVRELAKLSADDHLVQLAQRIEEIFNQLSGMNGRQILKVLAVEKPGAGRD